MKTLPDNKGDKTQYSKQDKTVTKDFLTDGEIRTDNLNYSEKTFHHALHRLKVQYDFVLSFDKGFYF